MAGDATQAARLATDIGREFRRRMAGEYIPRIRRCVSLLDEEQIWQRPSPHNNSVGNLLLHLEGNVRQWMLAGIRGDDDGRDRPAEFAAEGGASSRELMDRLAATVEEAVQVVEGLGPKGLLKTTTFQGRYEETGIAAVLHVMEHFSGHAGQIYAYTKQTLGIDLKFYDL